MVVIRSTGLALFSMAGFFYEDEYGGYSVSKTPEWQLQLLSATANERFKENTTRMYRFRGLAFGRFKGEQGNGMVWESAKERRERMAQEKTKKIKKEDGVRRAEANVVLQMWENDWQ